MTSCFQLWMNKLAITCCLLSARSCSLRSALWAQKTARLSYLCESKFLRCFFLNTHKDFSHPSPALLLRVFIQVWASSVSVLRQRIGLSAGVVRVCVSSVQRSAPLVQPPSHRLSPGLQDSSLSWGERQGHSHMISHVLLILSLCI